jgi:alpha-amylase
VLPSRRRGGIGFAPVRFRGLFATLGLLGTLLGGASCLGEIDDYAQQPIATHVTDWRDEVIYQLLVDRFADGDTGNDVRVDRTALGRYQGGDWLGVIQQLDYIQRLGVTTLWISPVVRNVDTDAGFDGYHGYWASDLTRSTPTSATSRCSVGWCESATPVRSRSSSTS